MSIKWKIQKPLKMRFLLTGSTRIALFDERNKDVLNKINILPIKNQKKGTNEFEIRQME